MRKNMTQENFLEQIQNNCSDILYISTKHMLQKLATKNIVFNEEENKKFFANYKNYHLYLNDFAGIIYGKYASSINALYIEMCHFLAIEIDNEYTLEHAIIKLEKQTPQVLMQLTDTDIQEQTIVYFDEKLLEILSSIYYNTNRDKYNVRVKNLQNNILLVKNALQIS